MKRLKYLNKLADEKGLFCVERLARNHYKVFRYYNEYTSFKTSHLHYSDTVTMSFEECEHYIQNFEREMM